MCPSPPQLTGHRLLSTLPHSLSTLFAVFGLVQVYFSGSHPRPPQPTWPQQILSFSECPFIQHTLQESFSLNPSLTHPGGDHPHTSCLYQGRSCLSHPIVTTCSQDCHPTLQRPAVVTYSSPSPEGDAHCRARSGCWVNTGTNGYRASNQDDLPHH